MLSMRGVEKTYGTWRALAGVTLTVATAQTVLLVGRNGAGKTTLLRIATGYLDPDAGEVIVDGIPLAKDRARAQSRLGYLPEQAPSPLELTVQEHLRLRARQKRLPLTAVPIALAAADLEDAAGRPIGALSKGYRQRVGLADALLGEPPLLVLDEPTSGMDPVQTRGLVEHLARAKTKRALLISSHAVTDLAALADRVVVIHRGSVVADGTPAQLCGETGHDSLEAAVVALMDDEVKS